MCFLHQNKTWRAATWLLSAKPTLTSRFEFLSVLQELLSPRWIQTYLVHYRSEFMVKMVKQLLAVQHSQYPTSIPFFWQIWRYSFIEIFPSLNGSAESKIAVKAKCVDVKWIYFREQEYVHYLFCLYLRGFFSPSVSARPQTPFWLTADSTMMKEKVEPLILLKLSKRILSEPNTRAHCLNLPEQIRF